MRDVFRKLGRQAERFKRNMDGGMEENADYECKACEARFATNRERCPNCGSEAVAPTRNEAGSG
ncbi:hypothetical protein [Halococcus salsus]|uniref:hypothetical protein n=1 Tax=Halococcus salsus TaxID=2162894 RepID=UPI00135BF020|nr:hypothetical protein [Halococcus salsus]